MVVIGIEHLTDISGKILLLNGHPVISLVKGIEGEALYGLGIPDP